MSPSASVTLIGKKPEPADFGLPESWRPAAGQQLALDLAAIKKLPEHDRALFYNQQVNYHQSQIILEKLRELRAHQVSYLQNVVTTTTQNTTSANVQESHTGNGVASGEAGVDKETSIPKDQLLVRPSELKNPWESWAFTPVVPGSEASRIGNLSRPECYKILVGSDQEWMPCDATNAALPSEVLETVPQQDDTTSSGPSNNTPTKNPSTITWNPPTSPKGKFTGRVVKLSNLEYQPAATNEPSTSTPSGYSGRVINVRPLDKRTPIHNPFAAITKQNVTSNNPFALKAPSSAPSNAPTRPSTSGKPLAALGKAAPFGVPPKFNPFAQSAPMLLPGFYGGMYGLAPPKPNPVQSSSPFASTPTRSTAQHGSLFGSPDGLARPETAAQKRKMEEAVAEVFGDGHVAKKGKTG